MSFNIQKATRQGISPLIVLYSESGCGKTFSSLLLARGMAGTNGKIVVADSESRRASLYADVLPGGFETFDLCAPFTPARYIEAIDAIEDSGASVGILDSGSHEWEGAGGVLDMAAEIEEKSGKTGLHCWRAPKFEHAKFVQRLLRIRIPIIVCLRAKYKSRQKKDERGKTIILKDEMTSPIQAEDFIFESTCHAEILPDHSINLTKASHPSLRDCFPAKGPIEIRHGELLRAWCETPGAKPSAQSGAAGDRTDPFKLFRERLWITCKPFRGDAKPTSWVQAEAKMVEWRILEPGQRVSDFTTEDQFMVAIDKVGLQLNPPA